jgi:hypothetical protein
LMVMKNGKVRIKSIQRDSKSKIWLNYNIPRKINHLNTC